MATLVGPKERYGSLGWPLVEDVTPGEGPLGGIIAALKSTTAERCLIVACDMPWLSSEALQALMAYAPDAAAVVARGEHGREPLCAVYHRRCLPVLESAFAAGERAVRRALERLAVVEWPVKDPRLVTSVNTPGEWTAIGVRG